MSSQVKKSFLQVFETFLDNLVSSSLNFPIDTTNFIIEMIQQLNETFIHHDEDLGLPQERVLEKINLLIDILYERYFEYKHIHLISSIIVKWWEMSSDKIQVDLLRALFKRINFDSLAITHNILIDILQQLLKNPLLKDEIICEALQHTDSHINLNLFCFILSMRKFNFDEKAIYSGYTILEFVGFLLLSCDNEYSNDRVEIFHYLLRNTKVHVNILNIYAVCSELYAKLSKPVFIEKFFIDNNIDIQDWISSNNFYKKIKKQPFHSLEELKEIVSEFCKTNQDVFLMMSDINNQNILSYCHTSKVLKELWESEWIPGVLKREYKDGYFVKYYLHHFEKINSAYYIHNSNSLEKLTFVHFFPIYVRYCDKDVSKTIKEKRDQFYNIAGKKLPINICKEIYNRIITTN
jgi:hypothetical protein